MPPSAPSVTTTGSSSTGLTSTASDNPRSLKNYDAFDNDQLSAFVDVLNNINFKNCDICLVTVPMGFPTEKLSEIPIADDEVHDIEDGTDCYIVKDTSSINKAVPIPRSQSQYTCRTIPKSLSITKAMKYSSSGQSNFIPRPEYPKISENLIERFVPFGCQAPENSVIVSPTKKKRKKEKRKLQNEDLTLDRTVDESPTVKKKKRKKSDLPALDENDDYEQRVDVKSNVVADIKHLEKMARKKAKKARKEAKKAKKKKERE